MSYRETERRLARLEEEAETRDLPWFALLDNNDLRNLSDEELDELCSYTPPDETAAIEAMTDTELIRLAGGKMPDSEWERRVADARDRLGLGPLL